MVAVRREEEEQHCSLALRSVEVHNVVVKSSDLWACYFVSRGCSDWVGRIEVYQI